jgi:hypothetical protein
MGVNRSDFLIFGLMGLTSLSPFYHCQSGLIVRSDLFRRQYVDESEACHRACQLIGVQSILLKL